MTSVNYADTFQLPGQYEYDLDLTLNSDTPRGHIDKVKAMTLHHDDVIVASYPKTGTTLLQEIVWLLRNRACDTETPNYERVPYIDDASMDSLALCEAMPRPRHLKTHLPYQHLPTQVAEKNVKICYVYRNPRDSLVSYYHFYTMFKELGPFEGEWNDYFEYFYRVRRGDLYYGNILKHFKSYWQHRGDSNVFVTCYEDLVKKGRGEIVKLADFLEVEYDDGLIEKVYEMTRFGAMKTNPATNYEAVVAEIGVQGASPFMRRGQVGGWADYFSQDQIVKLDEMVASELSDTDMEFIYE